MSSFINVANHLHMVMEELESAIAISPETQHETADSSLHDQIKAKDDEVVQLTNDLSELKKKYEKLKTKMIEKCELKIKNLLEHYEKTLTIYMKQQCVYGAEELRKMIDQLKILLDVHLTINDKIDKFISAYPGCQPSQVSSVQKLPDDVKKYCMELQNRVGTKINDFARHLGLQPCEVDKLRNETKDLHEVFWKVVCSWCTDSKEPLNMDTVRKAAAAIDINAEYIMTDMSKEQQDILIKHHSYLVENMMPTITLTYLITTGLLSDADVYYITDPLAESDKTEHLLAVVRKKGYTAFEKFMKALKESGQGHLADKLLAYLMTDMSKEQQYILLKHHSYLVENMMPTITLPYLINTGLLSDADVNYITDPLAESDKTEHLLAVVRKKGDTAFQMFMKALKESGQGHLADKLLEYLMTDMSKEQQDSLIKHHSYLVENMMPTITLVYLKSIGLLSDADVSYITDPLSESDKAEHLLTVVRKKGDTAFEKFMKALKKSGQGHLADKLLGDDDTQDQTIAKELEDDDVESDQR